MQATLSFRPFRTASPQFRTAAPSSKIAFSSPLFVGDKFGYLRKTPYTEQVDFGVQQQITKDASLSVDYIHIHGVQLLRTEDQNPPPFIDLSPTNTRTLAQGDLLRPFGVPSV